MTTGDISANITPPQVLVNLSTAADKTEGLRAWSVFSVEEMTRNAVERLASGRWLGIEFTVSDSTSTGINLQDLAAKGVDTVTTEALLTARFNVTTTGTATSVVFNGTVRSLASQLLAHSCAGAIGFLLQGVCHSQEQKFSLKFKCSPDLTNFLQKVSEFQAGREEWSEIQEQFHGMPFSVVSDNAAQTCLTATIAVLQGKVLAAFSNAYRTQHHVLMEIGARAQDAVANHGLSSGLPSSVGELGAGAGAGGAAVHSPGLYKGFPMTDEHDRLAIRPRYHSAPYAQRPRSE
jgi:hypothetical protein